MSEPIWSRHFANELAKVLGFPMSEAAPDGKDEKLRKEGEQLVAEITETFRYLPPEPLGWVRDLARFLLARERGEEGRPLPYGWPVAKLRAPEWRDGAAFPMECGEHRRFPCLGCAEPNKTSKAAMLAALHRKWHRGRTEWHGLTGIPVQGR